MCSFIISLPQTRSAGWDDSTDNVVADHYVLVRAYIGENCYCRHNIIKFPDPSAAG